jgi:RiboL-PSP-HEPN
VRRTQLCTSLPEFPAVGIRDRPRHGYSTFQQPDDIALAIRLFSTVELWKEIGAQLGENPQDLKAHLKLIVARRNKIAHEADIDPSYPGQRWPITRQDVEDAVAFVEKVGETVFKLVA